ncbi:hypothetical protein [Paenibacillus sp. Soil766]|uniref:hypothetical protein n=1 Tax=Paenibacillus sp. Soil766 TaxID=1736404 RepID=UPI000B08699A|nr:hypothetical protein [Paenibacillus sp. Soil766]
MTNQAQDKRNDDEESKCYLSLGNYYRNAGIRDKGIYYYTKNYELSLGKENIELESRT